MARCVNDGPLYRSHLILSAHETLRLVIRARAHAARGTVDLRISASNNGTLCSHHAAFLLHYLSAGWLDSDVDASVLDERVANFMTWLDENFDLV